MNKKLDKLVAVTENRSTTFEVDDMVHTCKRINNKKRDYLFANPGKEVPMNPTYIFNLFNELVENVKEGIDKTEKILVIGFAETATAIGHYVAMNLSNCSYHISTTRESIDNEKPLVEFREEHSHATQQLLYGNCEMILSCDRVLFVEDEITTGKTILNFIDKLKVINPKLKYAVASLVNWQNEQDSEEYEKQNIDTYFIVKGKMRDANAKVSLEIKGEEVAKLCLDFPKITEVENHLTNFMLERCGNVPEKDMHESGEYLYERISKAGINFPTSAKEILVLGTEEYMFFPMLYAKALEEKLAREVKFHATTRSPIEVSDEEGYVLKERYKLRSAYNAERTTFIYNLKRYDKVVIVTDCKPTEEFVSDIVSALTSEGCLVEDISIIVLGGK